MHVHHARPTHGGGSCWRRRWCCICCCCCCCCCINCCCCICLRGHPPRSFARASCPRSLRFCGGMFRRSPITLAARCRPFVRIRRRARRCRRAPQAGVDHGAAVVLHLKVLARGVLAQKAKGARAKVIQGVVLAVGAHQLLQDGVVLGLRYIDHTLPAPDGVLRDAPRVGHTFVIRVRAQHRLQVRVFATQKPPVPLQRLAPPCTGRKAGRFVLVSQLLHAYPPLKSQPPLLGVVRPAHPRTWRGTARSSSSIT
jgi:hypothetical protein